MWDLEEEESKDEDKQFFYFVKYLFVFNFD